MDKKKIFIQGVSHIGKSRILLNCLKPYRENCGGFVTQRMIDGDKIRAFCLTPFAQAENSTISYCENVNNIFLERGSLGWMKHDEVFEYAVKMLIQDIKCKPLIILDEIGGVELMVPEFRKALFKIIKSDKPVLGVIKSADNRTILANHVSLDNEQLQWHTILFEMICKHPSGLILNLDLKNYEEIKKTIMKFLYTL